MTSRAVQINMEKEIGFFIPIADCEHVADLYVKMGYKGAYKAVIHTHSAGRKEIDYLALTGLTDTQIACHKAIYKLVEVYAERQKQVERIMHLSGLMRGQKR